MQRLMACLIAAFCLLVFVSPADAKKHHRSHRGSCDGIHRCICGSTQARYFGLPRMVNGRNLWQASEWKRAFPQTSLRVGVVMYRHGGGPTGHVSRVTAIHGGCSITVIDERGEHLDTACGRGNVFVDPNGNGITKQSFRHQRLAQHL